MRVWGDINFYTMKGNCNERDPYLELQLTATRRAAHTAPEGPWLGYFWLQHGVSDLHALVLAAFIKGEVEADWI